MSETILKLSPEKEAAQQIIQDLRALGAPELAPYWGQDGDELAHVVGLGGNSDTPSTIRINADAKVSRCDGDGNLSIILHCHVIGEALTFAAIEAHHGAAAKGLRSVLQQLQPIEPWSGYGSLIELFESERARSEPNLEAVASSENEAEVLHGSVGWTTREENLRMSDIEITHSYVGDRVPSRMVHLLTVLGIFRCEDGTSTLLTEFGTVVAEAKRVAEQKRADAALAAKSPAAEAQQGGEVDEISPEVSTVVVEQSDAQPVEPASDVAVPTSVAAPSEAREVEPSVVDQKDPVRKRVTGASTGKSKPKAGGLVGNAQSLLAKAVEASGWTPGSGQTLSGQIPKGMAATFVGKCPKDVKHEVNGEPVVFSFSWAMGGGFLGFGKKAVTWSATQKS